MPTAGPSALLEHSGFTANDFRARWQRARVAALHSVFESAMDTAPSTKPGAATSESLDEQEQRLLLLLSSAPDEKRDLALRAIFDFSRKLALSLSRHFGLVLELRDLQDIFSNLGLGCFSGSWEVREDAIVLRRAGCQRPAELTSFYCDYWREAADGFVMGACEDERYARHASCGHQDSECVDVFFTEINRAVATTQAYRWGPIPAEMQEPLGEIRARFEKLGTKIKFEGFSEGALFYEMNSSSCGAGEKIMIEHLRRAVLEKWPDLILKDISPTAVYGEDS
jgi:hypothetical protein